MGLYFRSCDKIWVRGCLSLPSCSNGVAVATSSSLAGRTETTNISLWSQRTGVNKRPKAIHKNSINNPIIWNSLELSK